MADKPQITATIKFRGVTIENMTVQELRELRDVLNELVGQKEYVPYPVYPVQPVYPLQPIWTYTTGNTTDKLVIQSGGNVGIGSTVSNKLHVSDPVEYTISLN